MRTKIFFKPSRAKLVWFFILFIFPYTLLPFAEGRYRGAIGNVYGFFGFPGLALYQKVEDINCDRECPADLIGGFCQCGAPGPSDPGYPLMIAAGFTVDIIYWYFLACVIVWLFSLRKKQPPQTLA